MKKQSQPGSTVLCALLALSCANAEAQPGSGRRLTLGGFGTLGAIYHNDDGLEYRRAESQPDGAEADELELGVDSRAGVQVNGAWNPQLEGVLQVVSRLRPQDDWQPQLTRAFVRYDMSATLSVRGGRIGWDIFPRTDSRDIGYSRLAIRPAVEVYGFVPTEHYDGGELSAVHPVGDHLLSARLYGGLTGAKFANADGSVLDVGHCKLWGLHVEDAIGPWVLRLGAGVFELGRALPLDDLAAGLRSTGEAQAIALADRFATKDRTVVFVVAGLTYEDGPLQGRLLLARTDADGASAPNLHAGQLIGGYRIDRFTPYASVSSVRNHDDVQPTGLPDAPEYAELNAFSAAAQGGTRYNQDSAVVGVRYDFRPKMALKLQVDRVWIDDSVLIFDRRDPPGGDADMTVFGVALDFVF